MHDLKDLEFKQIKDRNYSQSSHPTFKYYLENIKTQEIYIYLHVHCSTIYNIQELGTSLC